MTQTKGNIVVHRLDWESSLVAALAGDARAADHLATRLLIWACAKLSAVQKQDREGIATAFVSHLSEHNFSRLANVEPGHLEPYLRVALRHTVTDHLREQKRREAREILYPWAMDTEGSDPEGRTWEDFPVRAESPEVVVMRRLAMAEIEEAVARMSATDQQVFALYFTGGLTEREVARRLGIPIGTVSRHIHSIRQRLRTSLTG
jgi:RNA polymerase sigma factor (sigma-70 family)